jgi:hypothetical protein
MTDARQLVQIIQTALVGEIKGAYIEADDNSIFLKIDEKIYLIVIHEKAPVNLSVRTFNPQPKPIGRKK